MSNKFKFKFNIKKAYIITFAIIAIVSTIALAGTPPTFQSISRTSILSGEATPASGATISTSRGQKIHNFVNAWSTYSNAFLLTKRLIIEKDLRVGMDIDEINTLYLYGDLQLSTAPLLQAASNTTNCDVNNIGRIRLRMPETTGTYCPLIICYPGTQGTNSGITRKSACDNVTFTTTPIWNQMGIMTGTIATN